MTATEIISTICSSLSESSNLSAYVQMATESLNSRLYGKMFPYAVAYKACHLFTLCDSESTASKLNPLGNGGAVTSYSEGGISIGYSSGNADNELSATKYGKMLISLNKTCMKANVNRNIAPPFLGVCI